MESVQLPAGNTLGISKSGWIIRRHLDTDSTKFSGVKLIKLCASSSMLLQCVCTQINNMTSCNWRENRQCFLHCLPANLSQRMNDDIIYFVHVRECNASKRVYVGEVNTPDELTENTQSTGMESIWSNRLFGCDLLKYSIPIVNHNNRNSNFLLYLTFVGRLCWTRWTKNKYPMILLRTEWTDMFIPL